MISTCVGIGKIRVGQATKAKRKGHHTTKSEQNSSPVILPRLAKPVGAIFLVEMSSSAVLRQKDLVVECDSLLRTAVSVSLKFIITKFF